MNMTFNVAGVTFENRQAYLINANRFGISQVTLFRDKANKHDPNAIKVLAVINGKKLQVGFVPKDLAAELAPIMDRRIYVKVTGWQLRGGSGLSYGLSISVQYPDYAIKKPADPFKYSNMWAIVNGY